jgi:hypothetical protein
VDAIESFDDLADEGCDGIRVPDIALAAQHVDLEQSQFRRRGLRCPFDPAITFIEVVERDVDSVAGQFQGDRAANAGRAACHQCAMAAQPTSAGHQFRLRVRDLRQQPVDGILGLDPVSTATGAQSVPAHVRSLGRIRVSWRDLRLDAQAFAAITREAGG